MGVWYATREQVAGALDSNATTRDNSAVDRAAESASRTADGLLHRRFYPEIDTRYFDWPSTHQSNSYRLWLDDNEMVSVSEVVAGGTTLTPGTYFLRRADNKEEPPYEYIECDLSTSAAFTSGDTFQKAIAVTGVYSHSDNTQVAGATAEALDDSETEVDVTDVSRIGVGSLIKVGDERMTVTEKRWLDSGQNTGGSLSDSMAVVTVPVTTGSLYFAGEVILIDSERMYITDVAGNNLIVKRAWDGTVLASHNSAADIYVQRTLVVERGVLGTTAASHLTAATVRVQVYPGHLVAYTVAEAVNTLLQEQSGYARTAGSGENAQSNGAGLDNARSVAWRTLGRKVRAGRL